MAFIKYSQGFQAQIVESSKKRPFRISRSFIWVFFLGYLVNFAYPQNAYVSNIQTTLNILEVYFWGGLFLLAFVRFLLISPNAKLVFALSKREELVRDSKGLGTRQAVRFIMALVFAIIIGKVRIGVLLVLDTILLNSILEKVKSFQNS